MAEKIPNNPSPMDSSSAFTLVILGQGDHVLIDDLRHGTGSPPADTALAGFKTAKRGYTVLQAPDNRGFLKTMTSGASIAGAAILVIDAAEGINDTARCQGTLLQLLGIGQVAVVIGQMDSVDFAQARFAQLEAEIRDYLGGIGITSAGIVPISGRGGDNIATASDRMPWYRGPQLLELLDSFQARDPAAALPLRLPVQDSASSDGRRHLAGRIETGILQVDDTILFSPSNKTATVLSIHSGPKKESSREVSAGQTVSFTLDKQIFVEPGEMVSHLTDPPLLTTVFRATVFWLGTKPLAPGKTYTMKLAGQEVPVTLQSVDKVMDAGSLKCHEAGDVARHKLGAVVLRSRAIVALDEFRTIPCCGCFTVADGKETAGYGIISMEGYPDQRQALGVKSENITAVEHRVAASSRAERNGHAGGVLWFTGLSGSGKSTLAMEVEQHLFRKGYHVYVLDGDNVRGGLNANLGFSPDDRAENIRRVGEAAALFADAGILCITAFISPYRSDRDRARRAAGEVYHEVYIDADLATCEERDPKGLYKKARAGEIEEFTGISAPYEAPLEPELTVRSGDLTVEDCVQVIVAYIERAFRLN